MTFRLSLWRPRDGSTVLVSNSSVESGAYDENDLRGREPVEGHVGAFVVQPDGSLAFAEPTLDSLGWCGCGPEARAEFSHQTLAALNRALLGTLVPTTAGVIDLAARGHRPTKERN